TGRSSSSRTISACSTISCPTRCMFSIAAAWRPPATRSWLSSLRRTVTPASSAKRLEGLAMNVQTQIKRTAAEEALLAAFAERGTRLPGDAKVAERREEAVLLLQRGLPNRKVEAWHYTDLRRLLSAVPSFDAGGPAAPRAPLLEGSFVLPVLNGVATPPLAIDGVAVSKVADRLA